MEQVKLKSYMKIIYEKQPPAHLHGLHHHEGVHHHPPHAAHAKGIQRHQAHLQPARPGGLLALAAQVALPLRQRGLKNPKKPEVGSNKPFTLNPELCVLRPVGALQRRPARKNRR